MAIYLVQHGASLAKDLDPEQSLSAEGRETVERIGEVAKGYGVPVSVIYHSGKKRAQQTAEQLARWLSPPQGVEQLAGLLPLDDAEVVGRGLDPEAGCMLVGHLPHLEKLCSYLLTGTTGYRPFAFQNGGIVCLDHDPAQQFWSVRWALMPQIG